MDTQVFKDMIAVIRTEQERRTSLYDPDSANDQWLFTDGPFINELYLMILLTLRHQVEREMVALAARAADNGEEISAEQYQENVEQLQRTNKEGESVGWKWKEIEKRLGAIEYESIKALRLLANSYKHDLFMKPNEELLNSLGLQTGVKYARLPESDDLRKGLANCIGLKEDADYCDIAKKFVDIANDFVAGVKAKLKDRKKLSTVNWGHGGVSLRPNDFER